MQQVRAPKDAQSSAAQLIIDMDQRRNVPVHRYDGMDVVKVNIGRFHSAIRGWENEFSSSLRRFFVLDAARCPSGLVSMPAGHATNQS